MTPESESARIVWGQAPQALPLALFHGIQRKWHDWFHGHAWLKSVLRCSRRIGKSYWCVGEADILARTKPGSIIRYAAETQKQVGEIIRPNMESTRFGWLRTCPDDLKPKWYANDQAYIYKHTDSRIQVFGCDNGNYSKGRGAGCDLGIIDECGFIDALREVLDVLLPQTMTTGGRLLMPSSPSLSPAHPFHAYDTEALERGAHQHATIYDAEHVSDAQRATYLAECGGEHSTTWKREYLAMWVVDDDSAIVPEFSIVEAEIVRDVPRPKFFDAYTIMDDGFEDLAVPVFAYWHFDEQCIVIERDIAMKHANTDTIACAIRLREMETWAGHEFYVRGLELIGQPADSRLEDLNERGMLRLVAGQREGEQRALHAAALEHARANGANLYRRALDGDPRLISDLSGKHGLSFGPVKKDDADAALAALRRETQRKRILVSPRARIVRAHMLNGIWNKARTSFDRSGDFGHFDAIDSVKYLNREVARSKNPYPTYHHGESQKSHWLPPSNDNGGATSPEGRAIEQAFRRRVS